MVRKYENWYLKHHGKRVFFNTGKYLTMLFNYCGRKGYIKIVPTLSDLDEIIRTRSQKRDVGRVYSDAEIKGILENAKPRTALGVMFGRYMGLRKKEFLSLKWESVDLKKWVARIWSFKNKQWRDIPIPRIMHAPLKAARQEDLTTPFVFPSPTLPDKYISLQRFDDDWTDAKRKAGISNWNVKFAARCHDLRHTFATQTARDNWPPLIACEMLDMSLEEYQKTYAHISTEDVRIWMKKSFEDPK